MKILIIAIIISISVRASAQSFYVVKSQDRAEQPLIDKLIESNRQVVFKEDGAEYTIRPMITMQALSSAKGYIIITDRSGTIVAKSKEYGSLGSSFNTNPAASVSKKIATKELIKLIAKLE